MENKKDSFILLQNIMVELFEINPDDITPDAHLYEDLDLDSIDAIDMIVQLQKMTDKKITPDQFKSAKTVQDIVNIVDKNQAISLNNIR